MASWHPDRRKPIHDTSWKADLELAALIVVCLTPWIIGVTLLHFGWPR
jgi:hypothetical protein